MTTLRQLVRYAWASPNTLIGCLAGLLTWALGGNAKLVRGVVEFSGGLTGSLIASQRIRFPYRAVTLGHVIIATDVASLDAARDHEHVHVRQYEQWGPFFLPAYLASSSWQIIRGRRCYRDNWFEQEAHKRA